MDKVQYVHATNCNNIYFLSLSVFSFDRYRRFAAVVRQRLSPKSNEEGSSSIIPDISSLPAVSPAVGDDNQSEVSSETHCVASTGSPGHTFALPTNEYMTVKSFETRDFDYLRFMSKFQQVLPYKMKSNKGKGMCAASNHVHLHSVSFPAFGLFQYLYTSVPLCFSLK
jgi:hypothetical protein